MILPSNPSWLSSILRSSTVLAVLCALAWFGWQSSSNRFSEELFIPIPKVKHLHPLVSLEWDSQKVDPHQAGKAPTAHPGYALALAHCTRCHGLPTPQQLPRETWPFVMTWMSNYLGYTNLYGPFQNNVDSIQIPSHPWSVNQSFKRSRNIISSMRPWRFAPMKEPQLFNPVLSNNSLPGLLPCKCPRTKSSP